jgi:hypothetical protein
VMGSWSTNQELIGRPFDCQLRVSGDKPLSHEQMCVIPFWWISKSVLGCDVLSRGMPPSPSAKMLATSGYTSASGGPYFTRAETRKGKRLEVKVPTGVKSGNVLRLGDACQATDGHPGDILIKIKTR